MTASADAALAPAPATTTPPAEAVAAAVAAAPPLLLLLVVPCCVPPGALRVPMMRARSGCASTKRISEKGSTCGGWGGREKDLTSTGHVSGSVSSQCNVPSPPLRSAPPHFSPRASLRCSSPPPIARLHHHPPAHERHRHGAVVARVGGIVHVVALEPDVAVRHLYGTRISNRTRTGESCGMCGRRARNASRGGVPWETSVANERGRKEREEPPRASTTCDVSAPQRSLLSTIMRSPSTARSLGERRVGG